MAQVIVNYSLEVKRGQTVYVFSHTPAAPLMLELYREILKAGGNAFLRADLPGAQEIFYETAQDAQLDFVSPIDRASVEPGQFDAYVGIRAETNTRRLSSVDPAKIQRQQSAMSPILRQRMARSAEDNYNWCVTQFPTESYAMDADMSLAEYTEFLFAACLLNDPNPVARWRDVGRDQQRYIDFLQDRKVLTVRGANADLTMRIEGRRWKNSQTNYGITRFSRNILFDEKIGGTFHMAVGAGYPDTGATNTSAVHWDMIAGAQDAEFSADGTVFYRDGYFLI
jgi:aminopeptidase